MFWTGFFVGFAACLIFVLAGHFLHERRRRAEFIANLTPAERESLKTTKIMSILSRVRFEGRSSIVLCHPSP